ncbi:hypothetical protein CEXT_109541 [Caerostris extrusa]|uniref:Uncharacterized protein n=1 Tax=Caerostris extrusa TaxID=172846 RepID=A0AAV4WS66_CAEEX|nr:hypothetical protein CEXT_109541 [Caerostris extrusa]
MRFLVRCLGGRSENVYTFLKLKNVFYNRHRVYTAVDSNPHSLAAPVTLRCRQRPIHGESWDIATNSCKLDRRNMSTRIQFALLIWVDSSGLNETRTLNLTLSLSA